MTQPILWERKTTLRSIPDIKPQLASWDKSTHPSQLRLHAYRQPVMDEVIPLLPESGPLYLHLDVDVLKPEHLLKYHDLENYLTPLFGIKNLDPARFVLVTARKYVGGGSKLEVGIAQPTTHKTLPDDWHHFTYLTQGSIKSKQWKLNLRSALAATNPHTLHSPAAEVQIAWRCSPKRNWVSLWKPTGDCMGPILGEENPLQPFAPNEDRIVELRFHRTLNQEMGNSVQIDIWWRDSANRDIP